MKKALAHSASPARASTVSTTSVTLRTFTGTCSSACEGSSGSAATGAATGAPSCVWFFHGAHCLVLVDELPQAASASRTALSWRRDTASSSSMPFRRTAQPSPSSGS